MNRGIILITGAARGIGKAIALLMAEEKYDLILNDVIDIEETAHLCVNNNVKVFSIKGDITSQDTLQRVRQQIENYDGRLVGLVNNAFSEVRKSFMDLTDDDWQFTINNSFLSAVKASKICLPYMIKEKTGSIVNICSVHSFGAGRNFAPYEASKAAMVALTKSLSVEFGKMGIRVNGVAPGLVITERNHDKWLKDGKELEYVNCSYPLGRPGKPLEVANLVKFLISEEASFISGSIFPVDGGMLANLPENVALTIAAKDTIDQ